MSVTGAARLGRIVLSRRAGEPARRAAGYLQAQVAARSGRRWELVSLEAGETPLPGDVVLGVVGDGSLDAPLRPRLYEEIVLWAAGEPNAPAAFVQAGGASTIMAAAGTFARTLDLRPGITGIPRLSVRERPAFPIRGHTFATHKQNTTHDKWEWHHWEECLQELAAWGSNVAVTYPLHAERWHGALPFGDGEDGSPWFDSPQREHEWHRQWEIQRRLPGLCHGLGLRYGAWNSVNDVFPEEVRRHPELTRHGGPYVCPQRPEARRRIRAVRDRLFASLPRLDVLFLPSKDDGGCPGCLECTPWAPHFLALAQEQIAQARRWHPACVGWLSLQGLRAPEAATVLDWLDRQRPDWVEGVAYGPLSEVVTFGPAHSPGGEAFSAQQYARSGPLSGPVQRLRAALPGRYRLLLYPDATHSNRSQYPIVRMDPAVHAVWQREDAPSVRPREMVAVHAATAPAGDGSVPYTEGDHDDVNKLVWSMRDWNPGLSGEDVAGAYARWFFGPLVAEDAAALILFIEDALNGPAFDDPAVAAARRLVDGCEARQPALRDNWRWLTLRIATLLLEFVRHVVDRDHELAREMRYRVHALESLPDPVPELRDLIAYLEERFEGDAAPVAEIVWTRDRLFALHKLAIRGVARLQHSFMRWDVALERLREVLSRIESGELADFEARRAAIRGPVMQARGGPLAATAGRSLVEPLQEFLWETGAPSWR